MKKTKNYEIEGEINKVIDIFTNLEIFGKLHPLIEKVENLNKEKQIYRIYEKPFKWIPIYINYQAQVIKENNASIKYLISDIPFTKAIFNYIILNKSENEVHIELVIEINSNMIVEKILMGKMIDAQNMIMNSIKNELKEKNGS